jgi:hypothetical protein
MAEGEWVALVGSGEVVRQAAVAAAGGEEVQVASVAVEVPTAMAAVVALVEVTSVGTVRAWRQIPSRASSVAPGPS